MRDANTILSVHCSRRPAWDVNQAAGLTGELCVRESGMHGSGEGCWKSTAAMPRQLAGFLSYRFAIEVTHAPG